MGFFVIIVIFFLTKSRNHIEEGLKRSSSLGVSCYGDRSQMHPLSVRGTTTWGAWGSRRKQAKATLSGLPLCQWRYPLSLSSSEPQRFRPVLAIHLRNLLHSRGSQFAHTAAAPEPRPDTGLPTGHSGTTPFHAGLLLAPRCRGCGKTSRDGTGRKPAWSQVGPERILLACDLLRTQREGGRRRSMRMRSSLQTQRAGKSAAVPVIRFRLV